MSWAMLEAAVRRRPVASRAARYRIHRSFDLSLGSEGVRVPVQAGPVVSGGYLGSGVKKKRMKDHEGARARGVSFCTIAGADNWSLSEVEVSSFDYSRPV